MTRKFTLWSPSAIGAIYTDKKGLYVYDEPYLTDLKTGHKIRVKGVI